MKWHTYIAIVPYIGGRTNKFIFFLCDFFLDRMCAPLILFLLSMVQWCIIQWRLNMTPQELVKALSAGRTTQAAPSNPEERKIEILSALEILVALPDRSGSEGRKIRRRLRSLGFRLSNPAHLQEAIQWSNNMV